MLELCRQRTCQLIFLGSVVPDRVRSALDVLANGVLILDEKGRIVLANNSFSESVGKPPKEIIGLLPSVFPWQVPGSDRRAGQRGSKGNERRSLPGFNGRRKSILVWEKVLASGKEITGQILSLTVDGNECIYLVNCSPINDEKGSRKGAMVGFDDVTEIEEKNTALTQMLAELESSKSVVEEQNRELNLLATRDPLTNCFNRRSLYERFEPALKKAIENQYSLSCIMVDIDHFKSINDNFGHQAGDEIIVGVADILREVVRDQDVVSRYGGEEYCILLPGLDAFDARKVAERCRCRIEMRSYGSKKITASFGISSLRDEPLTSDQLIDRVLPPNNVSRFVYTRLMV